MVLCLFWVSQVFSDVPPPKTRAPGVPYLFQSMHFQTVEMLVFPYRVSGMVPDRYSDVYWNPAYILQQPEKSVYLDFRSRTDITSYALPVLSPQDDAYAQWNDDAVIPRWYPQTSISAVGTVPLYHVAALFPVGSRLTIGVFNRCIFDHGAYRSLPESWDSGWGDSQRDLTGGTDPELQRLEVDDNQQTVLGMQSEIVVGYHLSSKIDLGLRVGHYTYDRDGNMYDSRWANNPHSSMADLNDESLRIDGNHLELGLGLMFRFNEKSRLGMYAGWISGKSTETIVSQDTAHAWSERDTDPDFYNTNEYWLTRRESYDSEARSPRFALTFESRISSKLLLRSFFSGTWSDTDITGWVTASDTTYTDRTYDYRELGRTHLRRYESHSSREGGLNGFGTEKSHRWMGFASLIYTLDEDWLLFGGIQVCRSFFEQTIDEDSDQHAHSWSEYSLYQPEMYENDYSHEKTYAFHAQYDEWSVFLPIGIKARVVQGFYVLLGTNLTLTLSDSEARGTLVYPHRITRKWEDGRLVVEDEEINRGEEFSSDPAKEFHRTVGKHFGIAYEHPAGIRVYFRSFGEILNSENWAFGFEMRW